MMAIRSTQSQCQEEEMRAKQYEMERKETERKREFNDFMLFLPQPFAGQKEIQQREKEKKLIL